MHDLLREPWVAALIDDAVAPFEGLLDADDLAWMRDRLGELIEDDPAAREAFAAARPRGSGGQVDDSGEVAKPKIPGVDGTVVMSPAPVGEDERTG